MLTTALPDKESEFTLIWSISSLLPELPSSSVSWAAVVPEGTVSPPARLKLPIWPSVRSRPAGNVPLVRSVRLPLTLVPDQAFKVAPGATVMDVAPSEPPVPSRSVPAATVVGPA